jgi:hypothetical protein
VKPDAVIERAVYEMVQAEPNLKGREIEVRGVIARAIAGYLAEHGLPPGTPRE